MDEGILKMEGVVGKVESTKINANLANYEEKLAALEKEAMADGEIDTGEAKKIAQLKNNINKLKKSVEKGMKVLHKEKNLHQLRKKKSKIVWIKSLRL